MVKLAANLSLMFTELPFTERFAAAAGAGFSAVEFMFPYEWPLADLAGIVRQQDLNVVLFNSPAGNWAGGERGLAAQPDRIQEFRDGVRTAIDYAKGLQCSRLHIMAGLRTGQPSQSLQRKTLLENLTFSADLAAQHGIELLLEPINTRVDVPGYYYDTTAEVMSVIEELGRPNIKLQYDIYHMQIMEGDLARTIEKLLPSIGHMQLADNPGRNEPGTGEINYGWLFNKIDALGYDGWIGCEYKPKGETTAGLVWIDQLIGSQPWGGRA